MRPGKSPARIAAMGNAVQVVVTGFAVGEEVLEAEEGVLVMLMGETVKVVGELDFVATGDVAVPVAEPVGTGALGSSMQPPELHEYPQGQHPEAQTAKGWLRSVVINPVRGDAVIF